MERFNWDKTGLLPGMCLKSMFSIPLYLTTIYPVLCDLTPSILATWRKQVTPGPETIMKTQLPFLIGSTMVCLFWIRLITQTDETLVLWVCRMHFCFFWSPSVKHSSRSCRDLREGITVLTIKSYKVSSTPFSKF
jgi:hypothetical protein